MAFDTCSNRQRQVTVPDGAVAHQVIQAAHSVVDILGLLHIETLSTLGL